MTFDIIDAEQRSAAWFAARIGRVTSSRASDVMATLKGGGEPAARRDYRTTLALERLTGVSLEDDYINSDMRRGVSLEPDAIAIYEAVAGVVVERVGFVASKDRMIGASPDGIIDGFIGSVEAKCPRPANHLKYLKAGVMPAEHLHQVVHTQLVTGAEWTDFISYCPQFPEELRLFLVRVPRDEKQIVSYELALAQFLNEVEREQAEIEQLRHSKAAA